MLDVIFGTKIFEKIDIFAYSYFATDVKEVVSQELSTYIFSPLVLAVCYQVSRSMR